MPSLARGNFGILAHPLPYLSTYLPILTFPVDREEVFINLYAEFFFAYCTRHTILIHLTRISSQIGTKLRDWAIQKEGAGC